MSTSSSTTSSSSTPTKWQLYGLSSIALVLCIIALIVSIVAQLNYQTSKDKTQGNPVINRIATKQGFTSTVQDHVLELQTTANGLLTCNLGALSEATSSDVLSTRLVGFVPNTQPPTAQITAEDTLLSAFEKCLVLKQTTLNGFTPTSGAISETDTILSCLSKLQYQQSINESFLFGIGQQSNTTGPETTLWPSSPSQGSITLPGGLLRAGVVINTISNGFLIITGVSSTFTIRFVFGSNGTETVTSSGLSAATYGLVVQATILATTNTSAMVKVLIRVNGTTTITFSTPVTLMATQQTFAYVSDADQILDLRGFVTPAGGSTATLAISNGTGSVAYHVFD